MARKRSGLHTETIICNKCKTINVVYVTAGMDDDDVGECIFELAEYSECSKCKKVFTDFDLRA